MGPVITLFWASGDIFSGFQSQSGQPYSCLAEMYVRYIYMLPTPLLVYIASTAASPFCHMHASVEVGCQTQMGDL